MPHDGTPAWHLVLGELLGGRIKLGQHIRIVQVDPYVVLVIDNESVGVAILVRQSILRDLVGVSVNFCDLIRAVERDPNHIRIRIRTNCAVGNCEADWQSSVRN